MANSGHHRPLTVHYEYEHEWREVVAVVRAQKDMKRPNVDVNKRVTARSPQLVRTEYRYKCPLPGFPNKVELMDVQTLDVANKRFTQVGKNVTGSSLCQICDESTWTPHPERPNATIYEQRLSCQRGCWLPPAVQERLLERYLREGDVVREKHLARLESDRTEIRCNDEASASEPTSIAAASIREGSLRSLFMRAAQVTLASSYV